MRSDGSRLARPLAVEFARGLPLFSRLSHRGDIPAHAGAFQQELMHLQMGCDAPEADTLTRTPGESGFSGQGDSRRAPISAGELPLARRPTWLYRSDSGGGCCGTLHFFQQAPSGCLVALSQNELEWLKLQPISIGGGSRSDRPCILVMAPLIQEP